MIRVKMYFLLLTAYFLLRNILMPLSDDDYAYAFIWDGEHGGNLINGIGERQRVESVTDIFESQYSHWHTWGGRVIAHFFAQLFIWIGKTYFDVVNTILFAAFIILVLKLTDTPFKKSEFAMFWIFIILFFVGAKFSASVIWMTWLTGTCSYFWSTIFQLTFLLPYVNALRLNKADDSTTKFLLMIPLGIFAGCSNEAGSLATIFLTTILIFLSSQKKIVQRWIISGYAALILGSMLCILAPGNFAQTELIRSVNPAFNFSAELLKNNFATGFLPVFYLDVVALIPTIIYFLKRGFGKLNTSDILIVSFAAAGLIVPLSMIFSPKFDFSRVAVISLPFMIISSVAAYNELQKLSLKISLPPVIRTGILIACCLYSASVIYSYKMLGGAWEAQINYVVEHKNEETINLPPMPPLTTTQKFLASIQGADCPALNLKYFGGLTPDKNNYINIMISQYYGAKFIVAGD